MRQYVDADILIWHLRGNQKALNFLRTLSKKPGTELWVGAMQRAEILFFMRPAEVEATFRFLSMFKTSPVDQEIVERGADLYRMWHPSHGVDINDALLAATAMKTGGKIWCLNKKHYPFPDLPVEKPWE